MSWLEILVVIGIIGFGIYQQLSRPAASGQAPGPAARRRHRHRVPRPAGSPYGPADIAWLTAGAAGSLLIGLAFGLITRLEARDGVLWGKMPLRGLWLWVALFAWRALIMVLAARTGAHVAASATPLLFTLGLNRLGQAAVIAFRAMRAGIPFAPEKDGSTFLADAFRGHGRGPQGRY